MRDTHTEIDKSSESLGERVQSRAEWVQSVKSLLARMSSWGRVHGS